MYQTLENYVSLIESQFDAESETDQSDDLFQDHVTCPAETLPVLGFPPFLPEDESMNLLLLILFFIFLIWKVVNWIYSFGSCFFFCLFLSF